MNNSKSIKLVSCDLNGTLVHQHTMMDMIRVCFPHEPQRYEKAKEAFTRQTSGLLSMEESFAIAGPLTKGLSLRNAIQYAETEMRFLDGFEEFLSFLETNKIYFVINSTGYSVTTEVVKILYGREKIYGVICNRLVFGRGGDAHQAIDESALSQLVADYFLDKKSEPGYDEIQAVGKVELGIQDEKEKAKLLFAIARKLDLPQTAICHIGDTMGDSRGIWEVARNGGLGIAFNYNQALKDYLENTQPKEKISGKILLVEPKKETSSLKVLLDILGSYI